MVSIFFSQGGWGQGTIVDIPGYLPVSIVAVSCLTQPALPGDVSMGVVPVLDSITWLAFVHAILSLVVGSMTSSPTGPLRAGLLEPTTYWPCGKTYLQAQVRDG